MRIDTGDGRLFYQVAGFSEAVKEALVRYTSNESSYYPIVILYHGISESLTHFLTYNC